MQIEAFFDARTYTLTYVVYDADTRDAVVIDPVLDYDVLAAHTFSESLDKVTAFLHDKGLTLHYVLETHAHADHLSGAQRLRKRFPGAKTGIGERITEVQRVFKGVFDLGDAFVADGSQFDVLMTEDRAVEAGSLKIETISTPGHTPACTTYKIGDALFTGDALFQPDFGVGRCDFPAGDARTLYESVTTKLYTLPDEIRVFTGHDYPPAGRDVEYESTIGQQKAHNVHLRADTDIETFVQFREARDKTLNPPQLIFQAVQVNVNAGHLPTPAANELRYVKIPLNLFGTDAEAETRDKPAL